MPRRTWSRPVIVATLRDRMSRALPVSCNGVKREAGTLYDAACYHFGSWRAALRAAGIPAPRRRVSRWKKAELVAILRRLARDGAFVSSSLIDAEARRIHRDIRGAIRRRFGTLRAARAELGLAPRRPPPIWTPEKVTREIRKLARDGTLRFSVVYRENPRLLGAIERRFGRWSAGLAAAGVAPRTKWTREEVLGALRRAWKDRDIRINSLKARFGSGIHPVAVREFGSWRSALRAAGVPAWAYETRMASRRAMLQEEG